MCGLCKGFALKWFVGAMTAGIVFFLILILVPASFGGGDVKLSVALGYYLGAEKWFYSFVTAIFLAGIVIVGKYILGKIGKEEEIAFGPCLCLGAVAMKVFM